MGQRGDVGGRGPGGLWGVGLGVGGLWGDVGLWGAMGGWDVGLEVLGLWGVMRSCCGARPHKKGAMGRAVQRSVAELWGGGDLWGRAMGWR